MYDDAPDLASYTTHHVGEIQKGDVFIAQNRYVHECPDMNMGLNGIGEELSRDIYVNLAAEKAMREITLSEYLVRHIARNIKSLNQSKVSPEKLENIAKYEKILTLEVNTPEVEQYIRSKAPTDNLDMHDYLAQLVEAPQKYPDCPSCVKEASTLLQGDGMLDSYLMWRFNTYPESSHLLSVSAANAHNKEINEKVAKMCVTLAQLADPTIELVQPKQPPMGEPLTP